MDLIFDWRYFAVLSAVFASLTAILAKVGVAGVPSNLATLIRTVVILGFLLAMVTAGREFGALKSISQRSWIFLGASGLCTGLSWACYFRALQLGPVSKVAPIDKLSLALTVVLAFLLLGEKMEAKTILGAALMVAGSLVMLW